MATTSPDGIVSPDGTDPADFISDWANTAASVQSALSNRASKTGTTAERNSAVDVRTGTFWFDTDQTRLYRYNGTGWTLAAAQAVPDEPSTAAVSGVSGYSVSGFLSRSGRSVTAMISVRPGTNSNIASGFLKVGEISANWRPMEPRYERWGLSTIREMGNARSVELGWVVVGGDIFLQLSSAADKVSMMGSWVS